MNNSISTIILCGGYGTRMKEETEFKPKPLVLVGGQPILWHIMKIYAHRGYKDFVLALGYKGHMIKDHFLRPESGAADFGITFAETGLESLTGERILRTKHHLTGEHFMVTYGDGVADIDINKLVAFHRKQGRIGTLTGVHPHSKYGLMKVDKRRNLVINFEQKPLMHDYVSGGFMIFNRKALGYFDKGPMENAFYKLAAQKQLAVYRHEGFWKAMDTYQEMEEMNRLWYERKPWAIWQKRS